MADDEVKALLDRFIAEVRGVVPVVAVWAHGSLALGDFRPGYSDFDLVAVVGTGVGKGQRQAVKGVHQALAGEFPAAAKLHCSYVARDELAAPAVRHVTWAHETLLTRPVGPVSRRELHLGNLTLFGPAPSELLPPVTDEELAAFIRADLAGFWLPATTKPVRWLQDIWVDLGPLTVARASVTLTDGRLITKGEALDVLGTLGAPPAVVADIRARRYGSAAPLPPHHRVRRARQARAFTRTAIKRVLAAHGA